MLTRLISRSAGLTLLLSGVVLCFTIALFLILTKLVGEEQVIDTITCQLGLSEDCLLGELRAERARLAAMQARTQDLEALYERLASLDHASASYVVFYEDHSLLGQTVHTGHRYASLLDPSAFTGAWCYIGLSDNGALAKNFFLADMDSGLSVTRRAHSADDLRNAGLSTRDVATAIKRCIWPQ